MQRIQKKYSNALVVMLKAPVAGKVKTRLAQSLGKKDAAMLYRCFIHDTFSRISTLDGVDIIAAYAPRNLEHAIRKLLPQRTVLILQKGKDLGERLANIFSQLFSAGYKKIPIIGTDSPDLPIEYIKKSFALLKGKTELVLGPAEDGGYYLIAMSRERKEIFENIPWSTDAVFEKTMEKAKKAGLKSAILPRWYDVDDMNSLMVLRDNLKIHPVAEKTESMLKKIFKEMRFSD